MSDHDRYLQEEANRLQLEVEQLRILHASQQDMLQRATDLIKRCREVKLRADGSLPARYHKLRREILVMKGRLAFGRRESQRAAGEQ